MPRLQMIRTAEHPYHVTLRSNNREWFDLPMPLIWAFCEQAAHEAHRIHPVSIEAFVLMSNHYHMLVWTPDCNLDQFMFEFNLRLSKFIRRETGRINRIFGGRYKWSLVTDQKYYQVVLSYIYQNPLVVGLVDRCEDYPFSTLFYVLRHQKMGMPIDCKRSRESLDLELFNHVISHEKRKKLSLSLSRSNFKPPKDETNRRLVKF